MVRTPKIGDVVVYHEPDGAARNSLVTAVWSPPLVNLVHISGDDARTDSYGRQIERPTSVSHASQMPVHGRYWRWPDEEPNPIVAPAEV